ncbi:NACHT domain-containing protein, partial [Thermodesulfobacteriota bacterium]
YSAWLQEQVDRPMFHEAFSLCQAYIPLRAYYEVHAQDSPDDGRRQRHGRREKTERVVVQLSEALRTWLDDPRDQDAIRVISGGPGSGKSSVARMFAAEVAGGPIPVLFVPLHLLNLGDYLSNAVASFVENYTRLFHNPVDTQEGDSRLLLIFDGLDEIPSQGRAAKDLVQAFVTQLEMLRTRLYRDGELRVQVIVTGRELVVQAISSYYGAKGQILHLLPYYVAEEDGNSDHRSKERAYEYKDPDNLLAGDQRRDWWIKYAEETGKDYTGLPPELDRGNLVPITSQPLLNYLLAMSYERKKLDFSKATTLNQVYNDLLGGVYERGYEQWHGAGSKGRVQEQIRGVSQEQFERVLEEIALCVWHGDGRTTTVSEVKQRCDTASLTQWMDILKKAAEKGITKLLVAFFFREAGRRQTGDPTFEFTHKSFGEYLTVRRIVLAVDDIHEELAYHDEHPNRGWDEKAALAQWAAICGPTPMDMYLLEFLRNEIAGRKDEAAAWQKTLSRLIEYLLANGNPMDQVDPKPTDFAEATRMARNAEEALLATLSACARVTRERSEIKWPSKTAFGDWICRLRGQRAPDAEPLCLECLDYLDIRDCVLVLQDFIRGSFEGAYLRGANLRVADLREANLRGADLEGAYLEEAILEGVKGLPHWLKP